MPSLRRALVSAGLTIAALVIAVLPLGGCASDSMRQEPGTRYQVERPERVVPDGVTEMREQMAEQRAVTLNGMDTMMRGTDVLEAQGSPWYSPFFDVLDFAASFGGLLF